LPPPRAFFARVLLGDLPWRPINGATRAVRGSAFVTACAAPYSAASHFRSAWHQRSACQAFGSATRRCPMWSGWKWVTDQRARIGLPSRAAREELPPRHAAAGRAGRARPRCSHRRPAVARRSAPIDFIWSSWETGSGNAEPRRTPGATSIVCAPSPAARSTDASRAMGSSLPAQAPRHVEVARPSDRTRGAAACSLVRARPSGGRTVAHSAMPDQWRMGPP